MKYDCIEDVLLDVDDVNKKSNRKIVGVAMLVYTSENNHDVIVAGKIPSTYYEHMNFLEEVIIKKGVTINHWDDIVPGMAQ